MRKLLLALIFINFFSESSGQTILVLKPSRDASIIYHDNYPSENRNYGLATFNGAFHVPGFLGGINICRALFDFDFSSIPSGAVVKQATISLFAFKDYAEGTLGVNGHFGPNDSYLRRVTSSWNEYSVTWNTKPTSTLENQVFLRQSDHANEDYIDIDVTALVNDMINKPFDSHGIMFGLNHEANTANLSFHSKDGPEPFKHPVLKIILEDEEPSSLTITCAPSITFQTGCNTIEEIKAAYQSWKSGFSVSGGINTINNLDEKPVLPLNVEHTGANLSFTLIAKGDTDTEPLSCTSTFSVPAASALSITCSSPVKFEPSYYDDKIIETAYKNWKDGFTVTGGINTIHNLNEIPELPENIKFLGANLSYTLIAKGECETEAIICTSTFIVPIVPQLSLTCAPSIKLETACYSAQEIHAAYINWKAGFFVTGGLNTIDNMDEKPSLPLNAECLGANLTFTLTAKGYYESTNMTCQSSFIVNAAPDLIVTSPSPVRLETPCITSESIHAAYENWKAGFLISGGCHIIDNLNEIPPLPENVECNGANINFTLMAKGNCEEETLKSTSTFIIVPIKNDFDYILYPNPGRNILKIEFYSEGNKNILMYTIEGKLIFSLDSDKLIHEIIVRDLAPGIYFVQCSNGQKTITRKYIKMIHDRGE